MAIIHKCDRCGKIIPRDHGIARSFTHRTIIRGNIFFDLFVGNDLDEYERDIELCKECNESFTDWFNAGEGMRKLKKIRIEKGCESDANHSERRPESAEED